VYKLDVNTLCREIMNTMKDGLVLIDPAGKIRMANEAIEKLTGYSKGEMVGMPCTIFDCRECACVRKNGTDHWCDLFAKGRIHMMKVILTRKDGSFFPAIKNASLMRDASGEIMGAVETFTDLSEIEMRDNQIQELSKLLAQKHPVHGIVGNSVAMQRIHELVSIVAPTDSPVLILGESGTGKELVAKAVHDSSSRRERPFIEMNCAALHESLLESELFGHAKGAFTGAHKQKKGRFETAHSGSLFLDEIGDMPAPLQAKLLRVLENRRFERVGEVEQIQVDVRIIAATNKDLERLVVEGLFREDLLYRINVMTVQLPALRERVEDMPTLVDYFLRQLSSKKPEKLQGLSSEAMDVLMSYQWPGNIRELKNVLEYASVLAQGNLIESWHLPAKMRTLSYASCGPGIQASLQNEPEEKLALLTALRQAQGNKVKAAALLGVNRNTVLNRMRKYGIDLQRTVTTSEDNHGN
jgi:two-component system response regulator HydG